MKKLILITLTCLTLYACKKEEQEVEVIEPTPKKHFTATVDGAEFKANGFSSFMGVGSKYYTIKGEDRNAGNKPSIEITGKIQLGTFPIDKTWNNYTAHYSSDGKYYSAVSGSITVTEMDIDTVKNSVHLVKATFNFKTDTVFGISKEIKNGDVYYLKDF
ncbi:MAG TPA: hypothetical protein PLL00_13915 [Bacteroidia bacterium]|jgi:hypothetical protein|nr:hypothetical protein [Bacteroidia bacterium]